MASAVNQICRSSFWSTGKSLTRAASGLKSGSYRGGAVGSKRYTGLRSFTTNGGEEPSMVRIDEHGFAHLLLRNPPVNSFSIIQMREVIQAVKDLEADVPVTKGIILCSGVENIFSAGLDLNFLKGVEEKEWREYWAAFEEMWRTIYTTPLPTVAAINGAAIAGGCVMALSCDYRIMANDHKRSRIGLTEAAINLVVPDWLARMTERTVGARVAEEVLTLGASYTADHAAEIGLVDELSSSDALLSRAVAKLQLMNQVPHEARGLIKRRLRAEVASMCGRESQDSMWSTVSAEYFQKGLQTRKSSSSASS